MRLTRTKLINDLQNPKISIVGYYQIDKFKSYRIDLHREIIHHHFGDDLNDKSLFTEMALWCFDNCDGTWCISWNLDAIYFTEKTDKMGFLLRWI